MTPPGVGIIAVDAEELTILNELVQSEIGRLTIEIEHAYDPHFRDGLCRRLGLVRDLAIRCARPQRESVMAAGTGSGER